MRERRKRIDIVRLTIYIIAVLAISGMAYATTYDFSSGEGVDKWAYEGYDDNSPSAVPPENETPLSSGEITAISASDTNRASYTPGSSVPSKYHFHRFKFKIKEEVSDILKLYVMYEGYGDFDLGGDGVQLYIWNYSSGPSGQWESIGYHTNGYDTIIEKDYMSGFSHYINATGYLQLLAVTYNQGTSCPFYYSYAGSDYVLDAEGLLFSIVPWWERSSIATLENLKASNGTYKIKVTEELDETSYIDRLSLLIAEHSLDVKVYPDFYNNLHTIKNPIEPVMAIDSDGNDCMTLMEKDDIYWLPMPDFDKLIDSDNDSVVDTYNESDFYKWLGLEYSKPENATQAKLLCRLKEDRFGAVGIWGGLLHTLGRNNLEVLRDVYANETINWAVSQMMRIEIWNGSEWIEQHRTTEAGASTKGNSMVILLNLTGINTNTLQIRFRSIAGVQGVDYAWIDYTEDEAIEITEIVSHSLTGGDIGKILHDDEDYLILEKGDIVYVEFAEMPNPENKSRTYLAMDNGYYLHNYDNYVEYTEEVDELINQIFSDELYAARYFMPKFYSSYYSGHSTIYTDYVKVEVFRVYNQDTGEYFSTIQEAINNANNGDTIEVANGTYRENIIVNKSITLKAASSPVIDGMGGYGINVTANDTVVQDMTVLNSSVGIYVHNVSFTVQNVILSNDTIYECELGIKFDDVITSEINESSIYNISSTVGITHGLYLTSSHNNSIINTSLENITGNDHARGIYLDHSDNNSFDPITIDNVTAVDGDANGINLLGSDNNSFDLLIINDVTAVADYAYGACLEGSYNNSFINTTVRDTWSNRNAYAISLGSLDNNSFNSTVIENVTANDYAYSIYLYHASDNDFTDTNISDVQGNNYATAIYFYQSYGNIFDPTIIDNVTAVNEDAYGLYLSGSDDNTFTDTNINDVKGNNYAHGIYFYQSDNNNFDPTIIENIVSHAGEETAYGVNLENSDYNNFTDTSVKNVIAEQGDAYGINLFNSKNTNFTDTSVKNVIAEQGDAYGVWLGGSSNSAFDPTIIKNVIGDNYAYGVYLVYANDNSFIETIVSEVNSLYSHYGFLIISSSRNEILDGEIINCGHGIVIERLPNAAASDNRIERNIIRDNTLFGTGVHLKSGVVDTEIHLNCFINNILQAHDDGENNNWDGNYWSDYPVGRGIYSIEGSAGSKDYNTLARCPLGAAEVPALTPLGMLLLIGLISLLAVIIVRRKQ